MEKKLRMGIDRIIENLNPRIMGGAVILTRLSPKELLSN
ncbi:hypothetical protein RHORCCE3_1800 [Rickettsia hoogstraalii str. RCCE3]|nr:hypothetical protein RHORCCE3_1800 [Rickettsia hoogstraalii str. RCCE3]